MTDEDYVPKKFYQPLDPQNSILHILLKEAPKWTIGHVDESLSDKQRSFSIDGTSIYDELTGEISEQFNCIFQFDSFNRIIRVYDKDTFGSNTTLFLSHENYIDNFTIEANADEIKNCFKVSAGDGIDIREVNPNGTNYIYVWGKNDLNDMTPELRNKLSSYDVLYNSQKNNYESIMMQIDAKIAEIIALESDAPIDDKTEDWTKYSLFYLQEKLNSNQIFLDVYKSNGWGEASSSNYQSDYLPLYNKIIAIENEIKVRQSQIDTKYEQYNTLLEQKNVIQEMLDLEVFLGTELWEELSTYRREQTYDNQNFEVTDDMTDVERFELEKQLYEQAYEEIQKINDPIYQFSTNMANLYAIFEDQKYVLDKFQLGNYIRVANMEDEVHKVRFIKATIDFEKLDNIPVEFSEMMESNDVTSVQEEFWNDVKNAATSYNFIRKQFNKDKENMNYVKGVRLQGLSSALSDVINADNQEFSVGSRGVIGKQWNEEKGDFEPEQIHVINNKIVFTDDTWKTCKMAIGSLNVNGGNAYGINAEVILGKFIIGEQAYLGNSSNTLTFNNDGLNITNGTNSVKINPNDTEVFKVTHGNDKVIWLDKDGNGHFKGTLEAANGTFSGSLNAANGTFTGKLVAATGSFSGSLEAATGTFKGSLSAASGTFTGKVSAGTIEGSTITGGTITGTVFTTQGTSGTVTISNGQIISATGSGNTMVSGNILAQYGSDGMFRSESTYQIYDDSSVSTETGIVQIKTGTILLNSTYNAYIRAKIEGVDGGYYKLIGLSKAGNIVIGQKAGTNGYVGGDTVGSVGTLGTKNIYMYCTDFVVNRSGSSYTNVDSGNVNSYASPLNHTHDSVPSHYHGSKEIIPTTTSAGNIDMYGGINAATPTWCAQTFEPKSSSDFRLKKDLRLLSNDVLDLLRKLKIYSYKFKDSTEDDYTHYGVLAQEVLSAMKALNMDIKEQSIVEEYKTRAYKDEGMYTGDTAYRVNYHELFNLLILGFQYLDTKVAAIESRVAAL